MTDKPAAHWTIYEDIKDKGWHLYEVEPMCRMKPFVEDNQCNEWVATQVAIKKYIGVLCGRLGSFISAEKLQKAYPSVSRHKPRFQVFVVPPDDEDLALFDSKTARPFGILSVRLPNKGFDTYRIALDWGKTKANKGDILYIFDRRKTGDLKRIRKEVVE